MAPSPPKDVDIRMLEVGAERLAILTFPVAEPPKHALTPVEEELLVCVAQGLTNAEIASRRGRSVHTIANQLAALSKKFDARSRLELIARSASVRRSPR